MREALLCVALSRIDKDLRARSVYRIGDHHTQRGRPSQLMDKDVSVDPVFNEDCHHLDNSVGKRPDDLLLLVR